MINNTKIIERLRECSHESEKVQKAYERLIDMLMIATYDCDSIGEKILTMSCEPSTTIYNNFCKLIEINAPAEVYDSFIFIANETDDVHNCLSKALKYIIAGGDNDTLMEYFNSAKDEKNFINKIDRINGKLKRKGDDKAENKKPVINAVNNEIAALNAEIDGYLKTIEEIEARCERAERELYGTNLAISKVNSENISLKANNATLLATLDEKDRIIERLEQQLRDLDAPVIDDTNFEETDPIKEEKVDILKLEEAEMLDEIEDTEEDTQEESLLAEDNTTTDNKSEENVSMKEIINLINSMQDNLKAFIQEEISAKVSSEESTLTQSSTETKTNNSEQTEKATMDADFLVPPPQTSGSLKDKIIKSIANKVTEHYSNEFDAMTPFDQAIMIKDLSFDKYDEDTTLCIDFCLDDPNIDNKIIYCMVAQNANPIAFSRLAGKAN